MSMPTPDPRFEITYEQAIAIARGWLQLLDDNGLVIKASELAVVADELRLAGKLDRVVLCTRDLAFGDVTVPTGALVVLDVKSSKLHAGDDNLPSFWSSFPIQIAAYAAAIPYDTERDVRLTWDEVLP